MSLEDIKARAEAATKGPWQITEGARRELRGPFRGVLRMATLGYPDEPDAEFITHAREDIPKLVAALEAIEEYATELGIQWHGESAIPFEIRRRLAEALA